MSGNREITEKPKKKVPATAFKSGKSGNPSGRPKMTPEVIDLVAACKAKTRDALDVLTKIMFSSDSERNRMAAALAIIERGHGKPEQPVKADVSGGLTVEIVRYGQDSAS
jgi:hypothetical protein